MDRDYFSKVIGIIVNKIDTLYYSHWEDGQYLKSFSKVQLDDNKNIFSFIKDGSNYNYVEHFTISLPSILKKSLFVEICSTEEKSHWPIDSPFSFEKDTLHKKFLPLKIGLVKKELLACIDDDRIIGANQNLISRNLYPNRVQNRLTLNNSYFSGKRFYLKKFLNTFLNYKFYFNFFFIIKLISLNVKFIKINLKEKNQFSFSPNIKTTNYLLKNRKKDVYYFPGVSIQYINYLSKIFKIYPLNNSELNIAKKEDV